MTRVSIEQFFASAPDNRIVIERATHNFEVLGDTLREIGFAASAQAVEFWGEVRYRITSLDIRPASPLTTTARYCADVYTETL